MDEPSAPAPYLDPNGSIYFFVALAIAAIVVTGASWRRFDEPTLPKTDDDYISQLLPHYLATPKEYSLGLFTYLASMLTLLAALSALGAPALKAFGIAAPAAFGTTPLVVGLAIAFLAPTVPGLKEIEFLIRRLSHRRAFIPAAARAIAERLTASRFDFSQYRRPDIVGKEEMSGVELSDLDASYRSDLRNVYDRRAALELEMARLKKDPDNQDLRRILRDKIRSALQVLYVFIGCSARLRNNSMGEMERALRSFGFDLESVSPPPAHGDLMIVGLGVMTLAVFVVSCVAWVLGQIHLWNPSIYFPTGALDPFIWALSTAFAHGAAIFTADKMRSSLVRRERWFAADAASPTVFANYVRVGAACYAVGYGALLLIGLCVQPPTWAMVKGAAPYALMPAVTGAFYALHLDNAELGTRPRYRLLEVLPQAIATGFMGFVASDAWISMGSTKWPDGIDFVILVAIIGFVVGASLAWYISDNVAARAYDPLSEAHRSRERELRTLASAHFNDLTVAEKWLTTKAPAIGDKSPVIAIEAANNYDDVLRYLRHTPPA
jgi:hypothetical protein